MEIATCNSHSSHNAIIAIELEAARSRIDERLSHLVHFLHLVGQLAKITSLVSK